MMLLHERLRYYAEEAERESRFPVVLMAEAENIGVGVSYRDEILIFTAIADEIERDYVTKSDHEKAINAMVEAQSGVNEPGYRSAHYVMQAYAESKGMPFEDGDCITDWLARWFIPRPRFEDGEPVQFGDEVELHYKAGGCEKGRIQAFHVNRGPVWMLSFVGYDHERLYRYDSEEDVLKRPAPKVLDADGVEIKVGDTVWHIESPELQMTVDNFQAIYGTDMTVNCAFDGDIYNFNPKSLTHREPDSLEKLREDMKLTIDSMNLPSAPYCEAYNRLTALIDRGA